MHKRQFNLNFKNNGGIHISTEDIQHQQLRLTTERTNFVLKYYKSNKKDYLSKSKYTREMARC